MYANTRRIKILMARNCLTLEELSEKINISKASLSSILNFRTNISLNVALDLSKLFNEDFDSIFSEEKTPTKLEINYENFNKIRKAKHMSIEELSYKSGITYRTFWKIKSNKKTLPSTIGRIAKALDVDVLEIIK